MIEIRGKKVFISGKITGEEETYKQKFKAAEDFLKQTRSIKAIQAGLDHCTVMNPSVLPLGFEHADYISICFKMIDACDAVVFLPDWTESIGAHAEMTYAKETGKDIWMFDELIKKEAMDGLIDMIAEDPIVIGWAVRQLKKQKIDPNNPPYPKGYGPK